MIPVDDLAAIAAATMLKATAILGVAAALDVLVLRRRASAATRHALWTASIVGLLLLPVLQAVLPGLTAPVGAIATPAQGRAIAAVHSAPGQGDAAPRATTPPSAGVASGLAPAVGVPSHGRGEPVQRLPARGSSVRWWHLLVALYAVGVGVLLAALLAERATVRAIRAGSRRVDDAGWLALLEECARAVGVRRPVTLVESDRPTMPLTWGHRQPFVLVPSSASGWPLERRRAVLLHELAHVARHDCLTQTAAAVACALYWPHPGAWWAAARLRVERELACDDEAIRQGITPFDYAASLLQVARAHVAPPAHALVVPMATASSLESRIRAVLDGRRARGAARNTLFAIAIGTALMVAPVAALRGAEAAQPRVAARAEGRLAVDGAPAARGRPVARPPAGADPHADPSRGEQSWESNRSARFTGDAGVEGDATPTDTTTATYSGRWAARFSSTEESNGDPSMVHIALWAPGLNTMDVPLDRLIGLTREQLSSPTGAVTFVLRRDAGTFRFRGAMRGARAEGDYGFVEHASYADSLVQLGMIRPSVAQLYSLARHGVELRFLDVLRTHGYRQPATDELVRAGLTSADTRMVEDLAALGYQIADLPSLIRLVNSGVTPAFIRRQNGVAGRRLSIAELITMHNNPSRPAAVLGQRTPQAGGPAEPDTGRTADSPVEGQWVHHGTTGAWSDIELFWTDGTNWRGSFASASIRRGVGDRAGTLMIGGDPGRLELDAAAQEGRRRAPFRFVPHPEFADSLRALGVAMARPLRTHDLKNLTWGGISAAAVREFQALGHALSIEDLLDLAVRQVTPGYAREMRALGIPEAESVDGLTSLRHRGVTPAVARSLTKALGRKLEQGEIFDLVDAARRPGRRGG